MCGILGYISKDSILGFKDKFKFALNELEHRGPDGFGSWESDNLLIGHRRLSIIDLSDGGNQPMIFNNRFVLSFNGEIYNYQFLRKLLEKDGFIFKGDSDSEVLLYAFVKWKESCLEKLEGMFAFAVWDNQENELFLARDRAGQKPLFFHSGDSVFGFSSEMKGLYPLLEDIEYNGVVIEEVLSEPEKEGDNGAFKYEFTDKCLIKGIVRLESGCFLKFKDGRFEVKRYWDLKDTFYDVPKSYSDQVEMFRELFLLSCKKRMQSDVPLATALSGGVDSSAITSVVNSLLKENGGNKYKVFIAQMKGLEMDESEEAMKLVRRCGLESEVINVDPLDGIEDLHNIIYKFEEMYLANPLPMINTYKVMSDQGYKVSIDGHGADELFGGYYTDLKSVYVDLAPNYYKVNNAVDSISSIVGKSVSAKERFNYFKHGVKNKYFVDNDDESELYYRKKNGLDYLNTMLYENTTTGGLPTLVRNYDRYSMISSVEVRCPFLDHELMSFAFSIPYSSKYRNGYSKKIVRDAVSDLVPHDLIYRKRKVGFHPPMGNWLNNDLKEWFLDEVNSDKMLQAQLISGKAFREKVNLFYKSDKDESLAAVLWEEYLIYAWEQSINIAREKNIKV